MTYEKSSIKRLLAARGEGNLWDNARFILADVPLDLREAKRVLPCGLRPSDPPIATLFVANYTKLSFNVPYHEAAVLIHVRTPLGKGLHCCWMVVDDDTALIYGREFLGYPKKMADIMFAENDDHISAGVSRRGVKVLTMEGNRGPAQEPPPPVFNFKTFNAGGPGQFFAINPIWFFRPKEVLRESYSAKVMVSLADSDYDPIARLVSGDPVSGRFAVTDILGSKYILPVGLTGLSWFANVFNLRFR